MFVSDAGIFNTSLNVFIRYLMQNLINIRNDNMGSLLPVDPFLDSYVKLGLRRLVGDGEVCGGSEDRLCIYQIYQQFSLSISLGTKGAS